MAFTITSLALRTALADLKERLPTEGCGALTGGRAGAIDAYVPLANRAARPETGFAVDPDEWVRLLYACERDHRRLLGFIHSHPAGEAIPSPRDASGWLYDIPGYWIAAFPPDRPPNVRAYFWRPEQPGRDSPGNPAMPDVRPLPRPIGFRIIP